MTKQYEGNIWTEVDSRGVVKIGFSRDYIDQQLMECFHVVQADRSVARKGQPIMVLETNDGTARIKSPINGRILTFNGKARDFPDRLSEEDVIMEVLPEGVKLETVAKKKVEYKDVFNQGIIEMEARTLDDPRVIANNEAQRAAVAQLRERLADERAVFARGNLGIADRPRRRVR